jgi:hypothetical protein
MSGRKSIPFVFVAGLGDITGEEFEARIRELTRPLNGQYPRPWMTALTDPLSAGAFVVGRNQAKPYLTSRINHDRFMDALFNRHGESCRGLYDELFPDPSPTRTNTDRFTSMLADRGVIHVLETNVCCYSTAMSNELSEPIHAGGQCRGKEIFRTLL